MEGIDFSALKAWMDDRQLGLGPIVDAVPLTGGTQNILMRFARDGRSYVLRRPPIHLRSSSNRTMQREAQILAALANTNVPHPRLIAACEDKAVLGAAFYLMEPVDGFNATGGLPPLHAGDAAMRHRMGLAMVEGISQLALLDFQALGLSEFGKADDFLVRQVAQWSSQLVGYAELEGWTGRAELPGADRIAAWLDSHRPDSFHVGIMHGDYHLANVMFRHDSAELAAIVDWELATIGAPLLDLGWLLATWPESEADASVTPWTGFPTTAELVRHYRDFSGLDVADIGWFAVLACYKLAILLEGTHARACAGRAPKPVGDRLHAKARSLFDRALRWIGQPQMEFI